MRKKNSGKNCNSSEIRGRGFFEPILTNVNNLIGHFQTIPTAKRAEMTRI